MDFTKEIIAKTLRVPISATGEHPLDTKVAAQLDAALLTEGFKATPELLIAVAKATDSPRMAKRILSAVKPLVGSHVKHNVYFKSFPDGVPEDTHAFWLVLLEQTLDNGEDNSELLAGLSLGFLDLLALDGYGSYNHSYEEMLEAQKPFVKALSDRLTLLQLGDTYSQEVASLFLQLAESRIPLSESDRELLSKLATETDAAPDVSIRENLALINAARKTDIRFDVITDALRYAAAYSDGDVTLDEPAKLVSFPRPVRRAIMEQLDQVIKGDPARLADVLRYPERWKRLGEKVHPGEYGYKYPYANRVFDVARGDEKVLSVAGRLEEAFAHNDQQEVIGLLRSRPGEFARNLDRTLRGHPSEPEAVIKAFSEIVEHLPMRLLCSIKEHFMDRKTQRDTRLFVNTKGGTWVRDDNRPIIEPAVIDATLKVIDLRLAELLSEFSIQVDEGYEHVAVPLTNKGKEEGFEILPRGSITPVDENFVRFFCYWKESQHRTDHDLSVQFLNQDFTSLGQVSWTSLSYGGAVHSGDVTSAPNGASEFIDIGMSKVDASFIAPTIYVYSGESFAECKEAFFGYMSRRSSQKGRPLEPTLVRMKSALTAKSKVILPVLFFRVKDKWYVKWMHLTQGGRLFANRIEDHGYSQTKLVQAVYDKRYLTISDLAVLCDGDKVIQVGDPTEDEPDKVRPTQLAELLTTLEIGAQ